MEKSTIHSACIYPFLKKLSVSSEMVSDKDFGELNGAHPM